MNPKQTIVTIDPGASGGIAVHTVSETYAVKMPSTVEDLNDYFQEIKSKHEHIVVFIEKVQAFASDDDEGGKKFAINKMLANYNQLLTVLKLNGFRFVEVYPRTWQSVLGLTLAKSEGEETKTQRKNRFKEYAQSKFPDIKVTLNISDALCLIRFVLVKIDYDIQWILDRIVEPKKSSFKK